MGGCKKKDPEAAIIDAMVKEAQESGVPLDRETAEKMIKMGSQEPQFDLSPFIRAIELREFDKAHGFLSKQLKSAWTKEKFSQNLSSFRDEIGDKWNVEQKGFMNNFSPTHGPLCNATYHLTDDWVNPFSTQILAHKTEQGFEIMQLYISGPSSDKELFDASKKMGFRMLSAIEKLDIAAVKEMLLPSVSQQVSQEVLQQIKSIFYADSGAEVLFDDQFDKGYLDGKKVFRIVAYPKGRETTHLQIELSQEPVDGMKIASFYFKGKL